MLRSTMDSMLTGRGAHATFDDGFHAHGPGAHATVDVDSTLTGRGPMLRSTMDSTLTGRGPMLLERDFREAPSGGDGVGRFLAISDLAPAAVV